MIKKTDKNEFYDYLEDNSGVSGGYAEEIAFPASEKEAIELLKDTADKKQPVTISGAGTGVVGGRVPFGGVIVATDKLDKIIDISHNKNQSGGRAVIEPGVSIQRLKEEAARYGLTYLPDPTEKNAFIGGTIGTNASGAQSFKYGPTRKYILGLHIILAGGRYLNIKRGQHMLKGKLRINISDTEFIECPLPNYALPNIKNAAGYFVKEKTDLIDLFIGQEGTLALVSAAEVSLAELPRESFSSLVFFEKESQALDFVYKLKVRSYATRKDKKSKDIDAACIEYFDSHSLNILRKKYSQIPKDKKSAVYFDQNIIDDSTLYIMQSYADFIDSFDVCARDVWVAESARDKNMLSAIRYDLPVLVNERIKQNGFSKISTDICVSDEKFPTMFNFYLENLQKENIPYCIFGHIGENHLHVNLMPEKESDFKRAKQIYNVFIAKAVDLKGTIAAEHGVGKLKREYFKMMVKDKDLRQMIAIKRAIDPQLLLGIGNIFDQKLLFGL